jgi:molybdopterin converting factor subunit 1
MKVKVLYFAAVSDLVGLAEEELGLAEGSDVAACKSALGERYPNLAARMKSVRIARNERFAEDHERIVEGDVLAVIPPVAGG